MLTDDDDGDPCGGVSSAQIIDIDTVKAVRAFHRSMFDDVSGSFVAANICRRLRGGNKAVDRLWFAGDWPA